MKQIVHVGIGAYEVQSSPIILKTVLGSCVGVFLYHEYTKIGALGHVYLPNSKDFKKNQARNSQKRPNFADIMIPQMIKTLTDYDINPRKLKAYIAGGAMLSDSQQRIESLQIGKKNLEAVRNTLNLYKILYRELIVGGRHGLVIECNLADGGINLRKVKDRFSEENIEYHNY